MHLNEMFFKLVELTLMKTILSLILVILALGCQPAPEVGETFPFTDEEDALNSDE